MKKLARNVSTIMFYSVGTIIVSTYLFFRLSLPLPEHIQPYLNSRFVHIYLIFVLGMSVPCLIGVFSMWIKFAVHFIRKDSIFEDAYSENGTRLRMNRRYFIFAAILIEILIDIWFFYE